MAAPRSAPQVLDQEFLEIRCKLIELAAALDRLHRSPQAQQVASDHRLQGVAEAIRVLGQPGTDRAEQIQLIFSDQYDPGWLQV